jgi:hypothetical protein
MLSIPPYQEKIRGEFKCFFRTDIIVRKPNRIHPLYPIKEETVGAITISSQIINNSPFRVLLKDFSGFNFNFELNGNTGHGSWIHVYDSD